MADRRRFLDDIDKQILKILQENCQTPNEQIAALVGVPGSTIRYRIKRLEDEHIIQGYHAKVSIGEYQEEFNTCLLLATKFSPEVLDKIKDILLQIQQVWAVYFTLGQKNIVVLGKSKNQADFMENIYEVLLNANLDIDIDTLVITEVVKEDLIRDVL